MTKQPSSSLRKVLSPHSSKAAGLWKLYAMLAMFRRGVGQLSSHPQSGCIFSCAYVLLSAQAILFSDREGLQGLVDLDAEIAKCEKKLQLARLNLDKVRKVEAQPDYVETVPENVRIINEDRVRPTAGVP